MENTHWKERLMARGLGIQTRHKELIFEFISTEIIKPLIADIPESLVSDPGSWSTIVREAVPNLKQQLRKDWL